MSNTRIWATDKDSFDIGCRVVKWDDKNGISFIKSYKYHNTQAKDLAELQKHIKQFTVHWSGTYRASHMANGLAARGLSVNFMIDDDCDDEGYATIYQCLPISKLGYSQGSHTNGVSFNRLGPGVEVSYQPARYEEDWYDPNDRKKWNVPLHDSIKAKIHGTTLTVHLPTEAQMKSLSSLTWGISQLFPDMPMKFPRDSKGEVLTTVLKDPVGYEGICGHFHLKRGKIDPAGIDFKRIESDVDEMKATGYNIFRVASFIG